MLNLRIDHQIHGIKHSYWLYNNLKYSPANGMVSR
jgi:hypothetical protein